VGATRLDNVDVMVEDLDAAIAFFVELGLELEGRATVEGESVDRLLGLENVRTEVAMVRAPTGTGLELTKFHHPAAVGPDPRSATPNTRGIGRIMFAVDDIDDVVERLQKVGGELVGDIVQYEDSHRLCYMRGPEGILLALAQELERPSAWVQAWRRQIMYAPAAISSTAT
jgi:catechol 2,3-dioxygenase-like lactoylglutathione lyase family enzyme